MTDKIARILDGLWDLWMLHPTWTLGQVVTAVAYPRKVLQVDDQVFEEQLNKLVKIGKVA
jgi:hypothetical protein